MTISSTLASVFGFIGAIGLILVAVTAAWGKRLVRALPEFWVKITVESIQISSAICAAYSSLVVQSDQKASWFLTAVLSFACILIYKVVQIIFEGQVKNRDRIEKEHLEKARKETKFRAGLIAAFHSFVKSKGDRTFHVLSARSSQVSIADARKALTPDQHLRGILTQLAIFLQEWAVEKLKIRPNIRVGVYMDVEGKGAMEPVHSESLGQAQTQPFSSYSSHRDGFRLNFEGRVSEIVRCVREKSLLNIVEDCAAESDAGTFSYYSESQRVYLKSMAVHFLGAVCDFDGTSRFGVLCVDSDQAMVFRNTDREDLQLCLIEFGIRIKLEMLLYALLKSKGGAAK